MRQTPVLALENVVVAPGGKALSLELFPGDAYSVLGPALSAKAHLVRILQGEAKPVSGLVTLSVDPLLPHDKEYSRRHTPQGIAKSLAKRMSSSRLTTVLSGLGLWDVRQTPIVQLPDELVAACDLLPVFLSDVPVAVIDGQLDRLDCWTRETTLELIKEARDSGRAFIVATNLLTIAQSLGWIILVQGPSPVFAGPVGDLLRSSEPTELIVETDDPSTIGTMVEPFSISVKQVAGGVHIHADKGQELAARLLTLGYGRVKSVVVKEPSLASVLRRLSN